WELGRTFCRVGRGVLRPYGDSTITRGIVAGLVRFLQSVFAVLKSCAERADPSDDRSRLRVSSLPVLTKAPATVRGRYRCFPRSLCKYFILRSFLTTWEWSIGPVELRRTSGLEPRCAYTIDLAEVGRSLLRPYKDCVNSRVLG